MVGIELTDFGPDDLDGAVALSQAAAWPHRREDWALFVGLGRGLVARADGRVVGTALTTRFGAQATISMVIVDAGLRGQGLGRRLMDAALAAAEGRACRLVATEAGLPLYERLGFRATGRIVQHQGLALPAPQPPAEGIAWASNPPVMPLAALDREACGMDRTALIARLAQDARIAVLTRVGAISGFAALRTFGRGEVIGPVIAGTPEDARALLGFVVASRPGAFLRVDTPTDSGLAPWLAERGLVQVDEVVPMRRGGEPTPPGRLRTFALAAQALG